MALTRAQVNALLVLITDIVNDDEQNWTIKRDLIREVTQDTEFYETALEEFVSWFETDDA